MNRIPGSRLFDDVSSQYLSYPSPLVIVEPFSLGCWFLTDDVTTVQSLMGVGDTGVANGDRHQLFFDGTAASDPIACSSRAGGTAATSEKTGVLVNTWHHALGVWASATLRTVLLDGIAGPANTTSKVPAGLDVTYLGTRTSGTPANFLSGQMAFAAIWKTALTAEDAARLAAGWHPTAVQRAALVACWDLAGVSDPEQDSCGGNHLTLVAGPTRAAGIPQRIWREPLRPWRRSVPAPVAAGGQPMQLRGFTVPHMRQWSPGRVA